MHLSALLLLSLVQFLLLFRGNVIRFHRTLSDLHIPYERMAAWVCALSGLFLQRKYLEQLVTRLAEALAVFCAFLPFFGLGV
jgi:hypothetical protein